MIRLRRLFAHNFKQLADVDLRFPPRGRFLIRGLNEAGKSTLFEAVYFGLFSRPLVATTGQGKLDDLIRYRQDEALVQLEVELAEGTRLDIVRRIRRDRPNIWELDIRRRDGSIEAVRANSSVNQRIEAELQLDGEALLNTCFVEQKKLDKLEGQSRSQREESLMRLLNLDALVGLGDELRLRPADQAGVERLRGRLRLATLSEELPRLDDQLKAASARLAAHDRHAAALEAARLVAQAEAAGEALASAEREEHRLAEGAAAAQRFSQALSRLAAAETERSRLAEARVAVETAAGHVREAEAAIEAVASTLRRGKRLRQAADRRDLLNGLAATAGTWSAELEVRDQRLMALAAARETLNDVRQALVTARANAHDATRDLEVLRGDVRALDIRSTLAEWRAAELAAQSGGPEDARLGDLNRQRVQLQQRGQRWTGGLLLAAVALAIAALFAGASGALLARLLAAAAIAAGLAGIALAVRTWRQAAAINMGLARLEGEAALRQRETAALDARRADLKQRLVNLNAVPPADVARADVVLAELDARLGTRRRDDIESAYAAAQQALARSQAEEHQLGQREAALRLEFGAVDGAELGRDRDRLGDRLDQLRAILDRRTARLASRLTELGVDDVAKLDVELGALRQHLTTLREAAAARPTRVAEHEALAAKAEALALVLTEAWASLRGAASLGDAAVPVKETVVDTDPLTNDWQGLRAHLEGAFAAAGGEEVRRNWEAATREAAASRERARQTAAEASLAVGRFTRLLAGDPPSRPVKASATAAELTALAAEIAPPAGEERPALQAEQDRIGERRSIVRHEIAQVSRQLGLEGEVIDLDAARAELAAAERRLAVRERAARLVGQASRRVMQSVLPNTLAYMTRLLPALTDDRYRDAQLSEDYRIEVYDERAGGWRVKNIFSGGTRDQFSLALRLSFALATLPEERGTAPGFLFLDEPLGAFDPERARALVELLTAGDLATSFDQIFLISHVPVDESLFDYHVVLADGRVAETNLEAELETNG